MIQLACSSNRLYIQHLCVMLGSVLVNTKSSISIHILNNDFTNDDKTLIESLLQPLHNSVKISFYTINDKLFDEVKFSAKHLTVQALYRLLLPNLLSEKIEKVLYLDCDIVVEEDIRDLFHTDLGDFYVGAVNEIEWRMSYILGLKEVTHYFNTGVLLLNLKRWRADDLFNKCLMYAYENPEKIIYGDQDILNGLLKGDYYPLDIKWNVTFKMQYSKEVYRFLYNHNDIDNILINPSIIHYIFDTKPWHWNCTHPMRNRYFHYLDIIKYTYSKFPELDLLRNRNIVVFGAGGRGLLALSRLRNEKLNVLYFCDNDSKKWGQDVYNVPVISPDQLDSIDNIAIIVASEYSEEICSQLEQMNLIENKHYACDDKLYGFMKFS